MDNISIRSTKRLLSFLLKLKLKEAIIPKFYRVEFFEHENEVLIIFSTFPSTFIKVS